jgi:hypothetical protein
MVPDTMPAIVMDEKPLMITNQVSLIDPSDRFGLQEVVEKQLFSQ